jgi:hypothetical protein
MMRDDDPATPRGEKLGEVMAKRRELEEDPVSMMTSWHQIPALRADQHRE